VAAILSGSAQQLLKTQQLDQFDSPHELEYKRSSSSFKYLFFNGNFKFLVSVKRQTETISAYENNDICVSLCTEQCKNFRHLICGVSVYFYEVLKFLENILVLFP
jgi:hypothetical protein